MSKEPEFEKCPDCQVDVGERHLDGCDTTRCRFTGKQQLMCGFAFSFDAAGAIDVIETDDHECEPCVWTGEWPGVKVCRDNDWYNAPDSIYGYSEDLNSVPSRAVWNPELEDWEARK